MQIQRVVVLFITVAAIFISKQAKCEESAQMLSLPTHADAAVVFAKYSGLFDTYVEDDADLSFCVSFLNKHGVYFGLMEVINGKEFKKIDCARVMGQIELVLSGEADYLAGKVILPKNVASWEDFCILNGVLYSEAYEAMIKSYKYDH